MNRISDDVALSLENRITEKEPWRSFNPTPAQHNKKKSWNQVWSHGDCIITAMTYDRNSVLSCGY